MEGGGYASHDVKVTGRICEHAELVRNTHKHNSGPKDEHISVSF